MGKGSGGGGAGSGAISHAAYMETFHEAVLGTGAALSSDLTDAMEVALGASPFTAAAAYDPDTDIASYITAVTNWNTMLAAIDEGVDWEAAYDQVVLAVDGVEEVEIAADIAAFAAVQDDQITTVTLPRFRSGMRDINMVTSSAFVVGAAVIEGFRDRDVAKHSSALRIASVDARSKLYLAATDQILKYLTQKYTWEESYVKIVIEAYRIKMVAKKEENAEDISIDEADAKWDLEVFQHGANVLAGIGGGVSGTDKRPSLAQSVIGGAMSGAAAGSLIAPGIGTVIGGLLGAASGLL